MRVSILLSPPFASSHSAWFGSLTPPWHHRSTIPPRPRSLRPFLSLAKLNLETELALGIATDAWQSSVHLFSKGPGAKSQPARRAVFDRARDRAPSTLLVRPCLSPKLFSTPTLSLDFCPLQTRAPKWRSTKPSPRCHSARHHPLRVRRPTPSARSPRACRPRLCSPSWTIFPNQPQASCSPSLSHQRRQIGRASCRERVS